VERVVEKVASAGPANYNDWALLMKIKLEARLLLVVVSPGGVDFQVDRMALDAICSAVPPEVISTLTTKATAREAWESIKTMIVGGKHVRKVSTQKLRREYELLMFRDGESVKDFAMRLTSLINQLETLGDPTPDGKPKRDEQANVVEDDEPTLMLARCEEGPRLEDSGVQEPTRQSHWPFVVTPGTKRYVELVEEEVFAMVSDARKGDPKRWIFDTSASNHMTGNKEVFSDLDIIVVGTMRFDDGSIVRIEGCGTILFTCKNGEHRELANTYYIPRLTANIVSCGQR
jgi:hypothetical protein